MELGTGGGRFSHGKYGVKAEFQSKVEGVNWHGRDKVWTARYTDGYATDKVGNPIYSRDKEGNISYKFTWSR